MTEDTTRIDLGADGDKIKSRIACQAPGFAAPYGAGSAVPSDLRDRSMRFAAVYGLKPHELVRAIESVTTADPPRGMVVTTSIDWDTDGDKDAFDALPQVVQIPMSELGVEDAGEITGQVADWLSDRYGWCVNSLRFHET